MEELKSVGSTSGRNVQIIVPDYTFTCHGLITNWLIVVRKVNKIAPQPIELQVWRPTGDNSFALIGSNMLPLAENEPEVFLLNYTVPLNSQIQVAPGDVVGAYYPLNPAYRIHTEKSQNESAPELYIVNSASPTCTFEICDTISVQKNRVPQLQVITGRQLHFTLMHIHISCVNSYTTRKCQSNIPIMCALAYMVMPSTRKCFAIECSATHYNIKWNSCNNSIPIPFHYYCYYNCCPNSHWRIFYLTVFYHHCY